MVENTTLKNKFWKVFSNELTKIFKSKRFSFISVSFILIALLSLYYLSLTINKTPGTPKFLPLQVFTTKLYFIPSFAFLLAIITPLFSIALGFDSFNKKEKNEIDTTIKEEIILFARTLAIIVSFAFLLFIIFMLITISTLIFYKLNIKGFELLRISIFYILTLLYCTLWYIISNFFSIKFEKNKQSLFFSILVYLIFVVLWAPLTLLVSFGITNSRLAGENMYSLFSNLSPFILYKNAAEGILLQQIPNFIPHLFNPILSAFLIPVVPQYQNISLILLNLLEFMAMIIFILSLGFIRIQRSKPEQIK